MATKPGHMFITSGPDREGLFDALKYAYDETYPIRVVFSGALVRGLGTRDASNLRFVAQVISITHADQSGMNFFVHAYIEGELRKLHYNAKLLTGYLAPT